ncbi:MAG: molybdopterin molybdotransferase MoeA [Holophaga sp.]|nr:molybdopterin molybdotransferase MoeA [Holophaga sp.]
MSAPPLPSLETALRMLADAFPPAATGAVLADRDDPALDRSSMDGAAMRSADGTVGRTVLGTLFAGDPPSLFQVLPGTCVRIMTGACLPDGADAVVPLENLREEDGRLAPLAPPAAGDWVRPRGDQALAGALLLPAGTPHNAARAGLRAQVGLPAPALRRLRVGIAPTGDEIVQRPAPHQIRDANGPMLAALAHALGADARLLPPVPDDPARLRSFLAGLDDLDILITSGGVSVGQKDLLPGTLAAMGARVLFHKIRLKPGKPMLAALLGRLVVLGLPGNPVSSYLNALLFLPVAMAGLLGTAPPDPWKTGVLETAVANPSDRPLLHPCRRQGDRLQPLASRGSADLIRLAQADACAWIPEGGLEAGPTRYLDLI